MPRARLHRVKNHESSFIVRVVASALVVLLFVGVAIVPVASGATTPSTMSPVLVARAGTSNVLYVLWEATTCRVTRCLQLERSNDGGATFVRVNVPRVVPIPGQHFAPINQLVFATPSDGYLVEYAGVGRVSTIDTVFATTDGGRTWLREQLLPRSQTLAMATTSRYVYALTAACPTKGPCPQLHLLRSPVGSSSWTAIAIPSPLARYGYPAIAAYGDTVWLTDQNEDSKPFSPYLATSTNAGRTFRVSVQPDLTSVNACQLEAPSSTVLWAACDQGMMQGDIVYSSDAGRRWNEARSGQFYHFGFGVFDAVSKSLAFFENGWHNTTLFAVSNESSPARISGHSPQKTSWIALDFTNRNDGVAIDTGTTNPLTNELWSTRDGGERWKPSRLQAG